MTAYQRRCTSNVVDDPNPRLEAYVDAARRGAQVQILLDSQFNDPLDPRSNTATAGYVNGIANSEGLNLEVRLGNPTGTGIHNKMVLAQIIGVGTVHLGSINGSENSSKNNREVAVQIESTAGYFYLEEVFSSDWDTAAATRDDSTAPAPPTGITATASAVTNAIDVDWNDSADADLSHYRLYVGSPGGPYLFAGATTSSGYTHTGLTVGQTYAYVVTTVDTAGNESANSKEASVLLAAAPSVASVSVSGDTSLDEGESDQFTATATLSDGATQNVTNESTWSSDNTSVATVTSTGRVTAQASGQATVIAFYEDLGGSLLVTVSAATPDPPAPSGSGVVINEFRARGPNGASDEFIELRNDSAASVSIGGWQVHGSNSSGTTSNRRTISSGVVLGPGCHYLLGNSRSSGYDGPTDATFGTGITDTGGLALRKSDGTIVDQVGMSSGSAFKEGTPLSGFPSSNTNRSYARTGSDTNNNKADFTLISPSTPKTSASSCSQRIAAP